MKDWNTIPTSARTFASARPEVTGVPSTRISLAASKGSNLLMQRINVDFPDPEGPMMQTTSPLATSRSMPFSASKVP